MITRAQAEALLTLAESLEACERQGLKVNPGNMCTWVDCPGKSIPFEGHFTGMQLRLAVNAMIPKSDTWVVAHTMTMSCPAWSEDIVVIKPVRET